jgi:translation initiation factor 2 alpha subunit (eIF-2alpha)
MRERERFVTNVTRITSRRQGVDLSVSRRTRIQRTSQERILNDVMSKPITYGTPIEK